MTEEPRPAELSRRIDDLSARVADGFREVGFRLDRMPTNDILLAYLATRDQEMKTNGEDIKDLAGMISNERTERIQAIEREKAQREADRDRAEQTRRFTMQFGLAFFVGLVGLASFVVNSLGGAG